MLPLNHQETSGDLPFHFLQSPWDGSCQLLDLLHPIWTKTIQSLLILRDTELSSFAVRSKQVWNFTSDF